MHAMNDLTPHAARLQYVALIHARYLTAALASRLKCLTGDALHLVLAVFHHIDRALTGSTVGTSAILIVETLMLTEVDTAGELADEHHINALDDLGTKRRRTGQRIVNLDGTKVGIEAELLADTQQALLRTRGRRVGRIPLGSADGCQQHGVRCLRCRKSLSRQRVSTHINRRAANQVILKGKLHAGTLAHRSQHLLALGNDLGANAVTREAANLISLLHVAAPALATRPLCKRVIQFHGHNRLRLLSLGSGNLGARPRDQATSLDNLGNKRRKRLSRKGLASTLVGNNTRLGIDFHRITRTNRVDGLRALHNGQTNVDSIAIKNASKALGDNARHPRSLNSNRSMLARRATTKVLLSHNDVTGLNGGGKRGINILHSMRRQVRMIRRV